MQKVIFLVDMNAFFISCEATRHPEIADKPAVVAGDPKDRRGIILTANYKAREFGVKTTMTLREALKLCPGLLIIPPDKEFYKQKSCEVMDILSSYSPIIQQNSIDEAWLDMTGCERIFGKPMESAELISYHIKNKLGLGCSIGISENKFLSKMASEMKKPLGITELWRKDIEFKLWPMSIRFMYGIGKQTSRKLQCMGIGTIGELALYDRTYLIKRFGKVGEKIHHLANGIDDSDLKPRLQNDVKSIGKSITVPHDIFNMEDAKIILMQLSDEVGMTARKYKKKGHTVQISIKYSNFKSVTRQTTVVPTCLSKEIYSAGIQLLEKSWDGRLPIRLLGISISGFVDNCRIKQISMFDMMKRDCEKEHLDKDNKIEDVIDAIREKYGSSIIRRAALIKNKKNGGQAN
ncbi:DNA polymerase IV [Clostridium sp. JNZ X4-2]